MVLKKLSEKQASSWWQCKSVTASLLQPGEPYLTQSNTPQDKKHKQFERVIPL